jgi:hypothetical protein
MATTGDTDDQAYVEHDLLAPRVVEYRHYQFEPP